MPPISKQCRLADDLAESLGGRVNVFVTSKELRAMFDKVQETIEKWAAEDAPDGGEFSDADFASHAAFELVKHFVPTLKKVYDAKYQRVRNSGGC